MRKYKYFAILLAVSMLATGCGNSSTNTNTTSTQSASSESDNTENDSSDSGSDSESSKKDNTENTDQTKESSDTEEGNTSLSAGTDFSGVTALNTSIIDVSDMFTDRDLSGDYDANKADSIILADGNSTSSSKAVSISEDTVTITGEGTFLISGTLTDGMLIVDAEDSAKVQLVFQGVTINSNTSAAVYVKNADKVFITLAEGTNNSLSNGGEFVAIDDNNIDGVIFSKKDLTLNGSGSLSVNSPADHAIVCKKDLCITNGTYDLTAASHTLAGKKSVRIAGGTITCEAGKDGIHAANDEDADSGYVYIQDGSLSISAESDGISAISEINIAGGEIDITKSYEGIEARLINISDGKIDIVSEDDGLNATSKTVSEDEEDTNTPNDQNGFGRGGGMMDTQSDANISVSGGIINVNANGDGFDSNGYIHVSGGESYIMGPADSGNAALDPGIEAYITGGVFVAVGMSGMAENFSSESIQCAMLVNTDSNNASGSEISLLDSEGKELISYITSKQYNSVLLSCPELQVGESYTVKTGDTSTEVTMESNIYGEGFSMGGHGGAGRPDGSGGERPDFNRERPEADGEHPEFNGERPDFNGQRGDFDPKSRESEGSTNSGDDTGNDSQKKDSGDSAVAGTEV